MSVYSKLQTVQKLLNVPKDKRNEFGGFTYRNVESIYKTAKPLCEEVGIFLSMSDRVERVDEKLIYVVAVATAIDMETGEKWSVEGTARDALDKKGMDAAQVTGTASSYARKRALCGLFLIDDEVDTDSLNNNVTQEKRDVTQESGKRDVLLAQLETLCKGAGVDINSFCQVIAKREPKDMPHDWLDKAVKTFPNLYSKYQGKVVGK